MKKIKIYSIIIIMGALLGIIAGKFFSSLDVNIILAMIICGLSGGLLGQKMYNYLDKKIR